VTRVNEHYRLFSSEMCYINLRLTLLTLLSLSSAAEPGYQHATGKVLRKHSLIRTRVRAQMMLLKTRNWLSW